MMSYFNILKQTYRNLFRDCTVAYPAYLIIRFAVSVLISILLVKTGFDSASIGHYEWLMFLIMICNMFWSSGIASAVSSYARNRDNVTILVAAFWLMTIIGLVVILLILGAMTFLSTLNFVEQNFIYLGLLLLFFTSALPLIESSFLIADNAKGLMRYGIWSQLSLLVIILVVALYTSTLSWIIIATIMHSILRWCYLVFNVLGSNIVQISKDNIVMLMKYAWPICLTMLVGTIMDGMDGLLVNHFFSIQDFAVYRYGGRELPFVNLIFVGLSTALIPQLLDLKRDLPQLKIKSTYWMHIFMPIAIVLMLSSPLLFELVYSKAYIPSAYIFNTYLLIMVSRVVLSQTVLQAMDANNIILRATIIELIANFVLSIVLVTYLGIIGLALGTAIAYLIQKIIMLIYLRKRYSVSIAELIDVKWYTIYSMMLIGCFAYTMIK
jgi:O-antigen/teichoic acid export membrane protein